MSNKINHGLKLAIGAALIGSVSMAQASTAFQLVDLSQGYLLAATGEGKCGEGKCGMESMDTNKDGNISRAESDAFGAKMFNETDTNKDGTVSAAEWKAHHEGKCGEGKCGDSKGKEGSCGGEKGKEGSCGGKH